MRTPVAAPTRASLPYRSQRAYVATLLDVLARLLAAGSRVDPVIQRELAGFPEGTTIAFSVLGEQLGMRVAVHEGRFVRAGSEHDAPTIEIVFKHLAHAFALLSFQESTPVAFARDRMVTHGDVALTMRFVRCLDRVQAVALPRFVAARALKSVPVLPVRQKLGLAARIYARALSPR